MDKNRDFLNQYTDVFLWLKEIGDEDIENLTPIMENAFSVTADHFNVPYEKVQSLFGDLTFNYSDEDLPMAKYFHEYLRKIRDSRQ